MPFRVSNIIRHSRRANRLFSHYLLIMRLYRFYVFRNLFYIVSNLSEYYKQCFRNKRSCELTPPDIEIERLLR
jgi:hypothetical protein